MPGLGSCGPGEARRRLGSTGTYAARRALVLLLEQRKRTGELGVAGWSRDPVKDDGIRVWRTRTIDGAPRGFPAGLAAGSWGSTSWGGPAGMRDPGGVSRGSKQRRVRRCLGLRQGGEAGDGRREDGSVRFLAGAGAKRQQGRARGSAAPNPWRAPEAARKVVRRRQQEREMGDKREGRGRPGSGRRWWCSGGRPVLGWLRPRVLAAVGAPAPMVADEGGRNRWMRGSRGGAGWWGEIERWRATGWRPRGFWDRRRGHLDR